MTQRQPLGKGLSALLPEAAQLEGAHIFYCPVALLQPNPYQPRKIFEESSIKELAESIKEKGVLAPLLVSKAGEGYYIIAGERRWRAAQMAGLERVPVVVKEVTPPEYLELALIENLHRKDLNPLEEAEAYKRLLEITNATHETLAKRLGKDRSTISNSLRLLTLPNSVKVLLFEEKLSMGHARALAGLQDQGLQQELAREAVEKSWSVRQLEEKIKRLKNPRKIKETPTDPDVSYLTDILSRALSTKVELRPGKQGGKLVVHFSSKEELNKIVEAFLSITS